MMSATARAFWPVRKMARRTPRYIYHRTRQMLYGRVHPDGPWFTSAAIRLLDPLLRPADLGAEFGSGHSTIWFAKCVAAPTSVERDDHWYETRYWAQWKDLGLGCRGIGPVALNLDERGRIGHDDFHQAFSYCTGYWHGRSGRARSGPARHDGPGRSWWVYRAARRSDVLIAPSSVMAETALSRTLNPNPGPFNPVAYPDWMLGTPA